MPILADVLTSRRDELIRRWEERVRGSLFPSSVPEVQLIDALPVFFDELIGALKRAGGRPNTSPLPERSAVAGEHGEQRLRLGFDAHQMVLEYGVLRDVILEGAEELGVAVTAAEMRTLGQCLTTGCAAAVAQYARERDAQVQRQTAEHVAFLAHELRNALSSARVASQLLRGAASDRVHATLDRSLAHLARLIDDTLVDVSLRVRTPPRRERLVVAPLVRDVVDDSALDAHHRGVEIVYEVPDELAIDAEPRLIRSALANLVRNAVKFSRSGTQVVVRGRAHQGRVSIEVEDGCGGLAPGSVERMFDPFVQLGADRSGFGLGLAIAKQAAEAHGGTIQVHNLVGRGCLFVIDLPV